MGGVLSHYSPPAIAICVAGWSQQSDQRIETHHHPSLSLPPAEPELTCTPQVSVGPSSSSFFPNTHLGPRKYNRSDTDLFNSNYSAVIPHRTYHNRNRSITATLRNNIHSHYRRRGSVQRRETTPVKSRPHKAFLGWGEVGSRRVTMQPVGK